MASSQEKMERAEAAARIAAAELSDVNREQRMYGEEKEASKMESHDRGGDHDQDQDQPREDDEKRSFVGNILKSVAETLEQTVTGKAPGTSDEPSGDDMKRSEEMDQGGYESPPVAEKAKEKKEQAKEKAEETKEKAKEKVEETKESAKEKARQAKEKVGEVTGVGREGEGDDQPSRGRSDDRPRDDEREEERPGILGSILKAVTGGGKRDDEASGDRTRGEGSDEGLTDKAKQKAEETKERTKEKAEEIKEKAREYKDSAAEKAKETKDSTVGKVSEYKEKTMETAKEAKDRTVEKAEETKDMAAEKAKEAKDRTAETAKETKDRTAEKAEETKETAVGKIAELKETVVEKAKKAAELLTGRREEADREDKDTSSDDAEARRKMAALRLQDEDFDHNYDERKREVVDIVLVDVEGTPVGQVASTLKRADQAAGQDFNDVGRLDDEGKGVVVVERVLEPPPAALGCPGVVVLGGGEGEDPPREAEAKCRGVLIVECDEDPGARRAD